MTNDFSKSAVGETKPVLKTSPNFNSVAVQFATKMNCWWAGFAILLAVVLRLLAALGDLEIDEVWTIKALQLSIKSFGLIFVQRHDNNHLLNTMVLYSLGPKLPDICYRLPAVIASIGSVWLAGRIAMRRGGTASAVMAWILVGTSYLLVLYGSEARGYSYAVFFSYLSWLTLQRIETERRWSDAALFAIGASLGFLSHLTFLYAYMGFCIWTIWNWIRKPSWILPLAHGLPLAVFGCLYCYFIRGMMIGGGPKTTTFEAIVTTLSIFMGGPLTGDTALIVASLGLVILASGFASVWKSDRATAVCYLTIVVLAPALVLMVTEHSLIYPRYFLIPVAFGLLMICEGFAGWWRAGWAGRVPVVVCFGVYLVGNLWWNVLLLDHGRGDYSRALKWMASEVQGSTATVSSDHDFRNGLMFDYYASSFPPDQFPLQYVDGRSIPPEGTDWHIRHNFEGDKPHPQVITDSTGIAYRLKRTYKHHGLTGWNWWIYRRIEKNE